MASILVIEDGTGKTNANSYVSASDARAYATARGYALPALDTALEPMLVKACDFLESKRNLYKGTKTNATQALQWPRSDVEIDGIEIDSDTIPELLKSAQCRLAIELNAGVDILPTRTGGFVKKETVGPLTTEYSEKIATAIEPNMTAVEALIEPLCFNKGGFSLTTVRV